MAREDFWLIKDVSLVCSHLSEQLFKLQLKEIAVPKLKLGYEEFESAGSGGHAQEFGLNKAEKLVITSKMLGHQDAFLDVFGLQCDWIISGAMENDETGEVVGDYLHFRGQIGDISRETHQRTSLTSHDYEWNVIRKYHMQRNEETRYHYDFHQGIWQAGKRDLKAKYRAITG